MLQRASAPKPFTTRCAILGIVVVCACGGSPGSDGSAGSGTDSGSAGTQGSSGTQGSATSTATQPTTGPTGGASLTAGSSTDMGSGDTSASVTGEDESGPQDTGAESSSGTDSEASSTGEDGGPLQCDDDPECAVGECIFGICMLADEIHVPEALLSYPTHAAEDLRSGWSPNVGFELFYRYDFNNGMGSQIQEGWRLSGGPHGDPWIQEEILRTPVFSVLHSPGGLIPAHIHPDQEGVTAGDDFCLTPGFDIIYARAIRGDDGRVHIAAAVSFSSGATSLRLCTIDPDGYTWDVLAPTITGVDSLGVRLDDADQPEVFRLGGGILLRYPFGEEGELLGPPDPSASTMSMLSGAGEDHLLQHSSGGGSLNLRKLVVDDTGVVSELALPAVPGGSGGTLGRGIGDHVFVGYFGNTVAGVRPFAVARIDGDEVLFETLGEAGSNERTTTAFGRDGSIRLVRRLFEGGYPLRILEYRPIYE